MKNALIVALALLGLPGCTPVKQSEAPAHAQPSPRYFEASALDLTRLLPPAPTDDSAETRADLDQMLKIQANRTPAEADRARADATASVFRLADALGDPPAFNAKDLPLTTAMFRKVLSSEGGVVGAAKNYYKRPRPFRLEPQIQPVIERPNDFSYPSGHSSWVRAAALVLADMVPERRAQIIARANEYARNRVVAGVHYPSDIEAGKLAGTAIAAALYASAEFRGDLAAATNELRQALHLPVRPGDGPTAAARSEPASAGSR